MLDVTGRSQRGRICEYKRGESSFRTPFIIGSGEASADDGVRIFSRDGSRYISFMGSEVRLDPDLRTSASSGLASEVVSENGICVLRLPVTGDETIPEDAEMIVVPNAYELRGDPRRTVDSVIRIRELAGYNRLVCMLGIAEPSTLAMLSYMGVDVFDDSLPKAAGTMCVSLIPEGECSADSDASASNCAEMERERDKTAMFITAGRLRELVDQRAPSSPSSVAVLRLFDRVGYAYQEEACSTVGCRFSCNTTQSLRRPDVQRYRDMIRDRYVKPEHKRILLLLPCSAKKPYHISKTHKAFASAIHTAQHDTLVHEVIVTSPLGIVPRELDVFYPANSYDIPVTGEWKCEERAMIRSMVSDLIAQGYDKIICHLGDDADLVSDLADMEETAVGDVASPVSLKNLDEALRRAAKGMESVDYYVERRETVRSVLAFQFGKAAADLIMNEDSYAMGKFPYWKIIKEDPENSKEKIQTGMLTPERGMISLTMDGAQLLAGSGIAEVKMMDFEMKGNLFAVGVLDADPSIRIGDEAVVTQDGKVVGVGVAAMSGREMVDLKRGIAVKMRHKAK